MVTPGASPEPIGSFRLMDCLARARAGVGEQLYFRGGTIVLRGPDVWVAVQGQRFHQVLMILLRNCVERQKPGADVWVEARVVGADLVLEFRTASPMDLRGDLGDLFAKFSADPFGRSRLYEGHGLELAIAVWIVRRLGGTLAGRADGDGFQLRLTGAVRTGEA